MNEKRNYQKEMDQMLCKLSAANVIPTLLLHSCCAPCSSYVLEYLSQFFHITLYYYNPNITNEEEYNKRIEEQKRLISEMQVKNPIHYIEGDYEPERFYQLAKGLEQSPEGGKRCFRCYELRLEETAKLAKEKSFDYFTTTLSISPLKNAVKLNEIGEAVAQKYDVAYLCSDFKKKNGYKRSIELSKIYRLYRQDYCGCIYSKINSKNSKKQDVS